MIKCLIAITAMLLTLTAYSQQTYSNQHKPELDPQTKVDKTIQTQTSKNPDLLLSTGHMGDELVHEETLTKVIHLPKEQYKQKRCRDSVFATKNLYIREAIQQGCSKIRIFVKKEGGFGGSGRIYYVSDLLNIP